MNKTYSTHFNDMKIDEIYHVEILLYIKNSIKRLGIANAINLPQLRNFPNTVINY